ncbi:LolA-like outer membrane lipoprotein chaperone [Sulfurimonas sp. HSL3-7]|uniref:LolA-like outer membrane lipoprotein chaperone n=1 Tax=Sulfonitrofixus jiaomeiensis TaxID=3131938 RepID=UPI0031F96C7D
MRLLFAALLSITSLFAISEKTDTMQADFVQTITDDKNSTITYRGDMLAKRPNMALWHYKEPVQKSVYITARNVTVIEPELEQVIIKKLNGSVDILAILGAAEHVGKNSYRAYYSGKEYLISIKDDKIDTISYTDAFDNRVSIVFDKQQINQKIEDSRFKATIPQDFDIISE